MKREPPVRRPKLRLQEYGAATRPENPALADAWAHRQGGEKAALDLDRGKPLAVFCEPGKRNAHVSHRYSESALDLVEVVSKGRLSCEREANLSRSPRPLSEHRDQAPKNKRCDQQERQTRTQPPGSITETVQFGVRKLQIPAL